jgi:hypothetical protein
MVVRYTSDVLYHFVGLRNPFDHDKNFSTLTKILRDGHVSHWPHDIHSVGIRTTIDWNAEIEKGELIVPTVTCYCDIPYEALSIHIRKYGPFGISFHRSFLVKYGVRPVTYIPLQSKDRNAGWGTPFSLTMVRNWLRLREGFYEQVVFPVEQSVMTFHLAEKPRTPEDAVRGMYDFFENDFFAFLKVFDSDLTDDTPENFYMEREWRKIGHLKFAPENVANVLVDSKYIMRLAVECPEYASKVVVSPY